MKRFISILLSLSVLMLCIVSSALADDFSVRNGIHFGMSVNEVKATETENGLLEESIYFENEGEKYYKIGYFTAIAGIENSRILYLFDKDSKTLVEIDYRLGKNDKDKETALSIFSMMSESLLSKYGQPIHSFDTDGISFPIQTENMLSTELVDNNILFYQWLIDYDDYYVLIDDICYTYKYHPYVNNDYFIAQHGSDVCYRYLTKSEVEKALQEKEEETIQLQEQINKDI